MKYKFNVEHIHNSFLKANPSMHPDHPEFLKAVAHVVFDLGCEEGVSMEDTRKNLIASIESDDCHVLSVTGTSLE